MSKVVGKLLVEVSWFEVKSNSIKLVKPVPSNEVNWLLLTSNLVKLVKPVPLR